MNRKLVITKFNQRILTTILENESVVELHCIKDEECQDISLGNIYVGKVKNIVFNISDFAILIGCGLILIKQK